MEETFRGGVGLLTSIFVLCMYTLQCGLSAKFPSAALNLLETVEGMAASVV